MNPTLDILKELLWGSRPHGIDINLREKEIELVNLLPHFSADLFAHLARIFACGSDTGADRVLIFGIKGHPTGQAIIIARLIIIRRQLQGCQYILAILISRLLRLIKHEIKMDIEQARGMFGPFQVAAHPV